MADLERVAVQLTPKQPATGHFIELLRSKSKNPKLRIDNVRRSKDLQMVIEHCNKRWMEPLEALGQPIIQIFHLNSSDIIENKRITIDELCRQAEVPNGAKSTLTLEYFVPLDTLEDTASSVAATSGGSSSQAAPEDDETADVLDDEIECTGERSLDDRNREGRKRAIDLTECSSSSRKRSHGELSARIANARSLCDSDVDAEYRELIKPAVEDYLRDTIDKDELDRRKMAARETAAAKHPPLVTLNQAYKEYELKRLALAAAEAALDMSEAGLEAALIAIEQAKKKVSPEEAGEVKAES